MAKQRDQLSNEAGDDTTLAERLFAKHWNPKGPSEVEHVARLCLDAAETFERVKRERNSPQLRATA